MHALFSQGYSFSQASIVVKPYPASRCYHPAWCAAPFWPRRDGAAMALLNVRSVITPRLKKLAEVRELEARVAMLGVVEPLGKAVASLICPVKMQTSGFLL